MDRKLHDKQMWEAAAVLDEKDDEIERLSSESKNYKSLWQEAADFAVSEESRLLSEGKHMKYALDTLKLYAEADGEVTRNVVVDIVDEALAQIQEK